ncbi:PREDICTED: ATP synthase mitochondrial F1 complex assembly factor 2-like [Priapulus caudatus]|uniref:ATP synthase mitochondrial F1 complex assembly factor 2-like n=1 Tax=Priapulus caudatus TaxID=37621 RepID=A0ABM1DT98_PRICU|nr:PREDICTED: ATP synthase mitochondrial F1 complex assembly factor 2-like [Priapulus caudatus]
MGDGEQVCYRYSDPPGLEQFETALWDPLLLWFTKRYNVQLSSTLGLNLLDIPDDTKRTIQRHLLTYNAWALVGILHAVEALKSVVISLALIDKFVSVEQAVYFSRLECEFQISKWGNVEEAHDMEKTETQARAAAATLFVHMCSETERAQHKLQQPPQ